MEGFAPNVSTFWGVGLAQSDIDLLEIYRKALESVSEVEFINPSEEALRSASTLLGIRPTWYPELDRWLEMQR